MAPQSGPFNAPVAAFVDEGMKVQGWLPVNDHQGATYEELIEIVRLEAMTRSLAGQIEGAALMIQLSAPDGRDGVGVQIHTRKSSVMLVFPWLPIGRR